MLDAAVSYSFLRTTHPGQAAVSTQGLAAHVGWRGPGDWQATVFARAASGLPYTRLSNSGFGILASEESGLIFLPATGPLNGSHLPWTKTVDLRLAKNVRTAGGEWTVFADFRNLFGVTNTTDVYAETGTDRNDPYHQSVLGDEYARLQIEANSNGALLPGNTVDLRSCATWTANTTGVVNCVALGRVERRFGDGDGLYTQTEQDRALNTYFDSFAGSWRFHGPGRTVRVGMELRL